MAWSFISLLAGMLLMVHVVQVKPRSFLVLIYTSSRLILFRWSQWLRFGCLNFAGCFNLKEEFLNEQCQRWQIEKLNFLRKQRSHTTLHPWPLVIVAYDSVSWIRCTMSHRTLSTKARWNRVAKKMRFVRLSVRRRSIESPTWRHHHEEWEVEESAPANPSRVTKVLWKQPTVDQCHDNGTNDPWQFARRSSFNTVHRLA